MASDDEQTGYGLIVSFPDQSQAFTLGFEAGMLWQRMRAGAEAEIEACTRVENREVIRRQATADGWTLEVDPTGTDGWDSTILRKAAKAPDRPNPRGLAVVGGTDV